MTGGTPTGGHVSDRKVTQDTSTLVGWWWKGLVYPQNAVVVLARTSIGSAVLKAGLVVRKAFSCTVMERKIAGITHGSRVQKEAGGRNDLRNPCGESGW